MSWDEEQPIWELTVGRCETEGAVGETVYGIRVTAGTFCWRFADVDADPQRVERLLQRLRQERPHPCHLEDVVRDFIDGGEE